MLDTLINWSNQNSGFLGLLIFVATLLLGWVSGIFGYLRHKPEFKLEVIPGPTLCCVITTGKKHEEFDIHRTGISLYLRVTNIGTSASSIKTIQVAFHWHLKPFSWLWLRYKIFWYWVQNPIITMDDFQYDFGDRVKVYPSLFQETQLTGVQNDTYLEIGRTVNGVVYFEKDDSWGGCFPAPLKTGHTQIRVAVFDSSGKKHKKTFLVPMVSLEEARKYNPSFCGTFATIKNNENIGDFAAALFNRFKPDA